MNLYFILFGDRGILKNLDAPGQNIYMYIGWRDLDDRPSRATWDFCIEEELELLDIESYMRLLDGGLRNWTSIATMDYWMQGFGNWTSTTSRSY